MQSIREIRESIGRGETKADGALAASREAIAARDGQVGAFVRLASPSPAGTGPLSGIAVAVKDIVDTADMPTEMGSPIYAGWRPKADAAIVTALKRAGATIVGKSATTAFANSDPAPTRNPHRASHTPGGSSAGSAAAVGGGMVPLAVGTQTAGSVIRPASFCGAAAVKPSFRLIPTVGVKTLAWTLDTLGLFAATVGDCAIALEAVTGRPATAGRTGPFRFGIVRQEFAGVADPDAEEALSRAASRLSEAGASVVDVAVPGSLAEAWAAQAIVQDFESAQALAWEYATHPDAIGPKLAAKLREGSAIPAAGYDDARRAANRGRRDAKAVFADIDVVLTYSAPGEAPSGLESTGDPRFNRLWTALGTPSVNVPGSIGRTGLPIGLQVVGPFAADADTLDAARFLEPLIATPR